MYSADQIIKKILCLEKIYLLVLTNRSMLIRRHFSKGASMINPRTVEKSITDENTQSQPDVYSLEICTELSFSESKESFPSPILRSKAAPTSKSSTCISLTKFGFHRELSCLQKLLLLFCSLMAAYETFAPAEKASNDFIGLFATPDELTRNLSRSAAAIISFIIMFSTLKGMGKGLRNIERYSARQDAHGEQLLGLKMTVDEQAVEIIKLKLMLEELKYSQTEMKRQNARKVSFASLSPALFAVRMMPPLILPDAPDVDGDAQLKDSPTAMPRERATV